MFGLLNRGTLSADTEHEFEHLISKLKELWLTEHNEDGTHLVRPSGFDFVPIGFMGEWPTNTPPSGWLICDGSPVSRVTYKALFDVIGTTFGVGDGTTTYNLPDRRGRFGLSKAAAGTGSSIGAAGGALDHTHSGGTFSGVTGATAPGTDTQGAHDHGGATGAEAAHTHSVSITSDPATVTVSGFDVGLFSAAGGAQLQHTHAVSGTTGAGSSHSHTISSGGGHSHTVNSHTHDAGTLALSASGGSNPAYLVFGNTIILAGV